MRITFKCNSNLSPEVFWYLWIINNNNTDDNESITQLKLKIFGGCPGPTWVVFRCCRRKRWCCFVVCQSVSDCYACVLSTSQMWAKVRKMWIYIHTLMYKFILYKLLWFDSIICINNLLIHIIITILDYHLTNKLMWQ